MFIKIEDSTGTRTAAALPTEPSDVGGPPTTISLQITNSDGSTVTATSLPIEPVADEGEE